MTGPATPGQEGPSYAPPPLPEGWIAQWDGVSRKYYFVQLSTGASQWDTPTQPAPTGPTPQATPQGGMEHPYGQPGQGPNQYDGGPGGAGDGERGLSQMAMNQLLGGGKKQNNSSGLGQLGGLATQFLGSGHSNQSSHSNSGAAGIVGALAGSLLGGGKKPNQQNYSGSQNHQQSGAGGLMGSLGGMFGGHQNQGQGGNFGYSQHNNQQGGYTGSAPPTSYQPGGAGHTPYNAPATQQHSYQSPPPAQSYNAQQPSYGAPTHQQQPAYGAPPGQQPAYGAQQPPYGGTSSQQPPYGGTAPQHPPYGGVQHQDSYGGGAPPPSSYQAPGGYTPQGGAPYGQQPSHSGNLAQPHHQHFQGLHSAEHSGGLYGNAPSGGAPNVPMNTHPNQGQQGHQGW